MVEASSSLTKLLITKDMLAQGQHSLQGFLFAIQAGEAGGFKQLVLYFIAFYASLFGTNKWLANRSTAYSLNLFFHLPVLMTALSMLQYSLPKSLNGIMVGLLTGMLLANQKCVKIHDAVKTRYWGFKLTDLSMLGMILSLPFETLAILRYKPGLQSNIVTVYYAIFTSTLIYQLNSRSISDYAQEIDAITAEFSIEKENSVSSDWEAVNKNEKLLESEQAEHSKDYWRAIGISVIGLLCNMVIPVICLIRALRLLKSSNMVLSDLL